MVLQTQARKMILIFAIFFRFFEIVVILSFLALGVKKPPLVFAKGLMMDYCIVCSGNGMVCNFYPLLPIMNFSFF